MYIDACIEAARVACLLMLIQQTLTMLRGLCNDCVPVSSADDMWLSLGELGVHQNEEHFQLGKVEDEIKSLVQKK